MAEGDGKFVTLRFARARISRVVGCCRALHYAVSVDHGDDFWDTRNFTYNVSPECTVAKVVNGSHDIISAPRAVMQNIPGIQIPEFCTATSKVEKLVNDKS